MEKYASVVPVKFFPLLLIFLPFMGPAQLPFENSRFAEVDGERIHYRVWEAAEGSPGSRAAGVVLIHGFGASTYSWQQVADSLSQSGFQVIAVDMPPFGYSTKTPGINQSFTAHAMRLHRLLHEHFPGKNWHLAGHSMGGGVAQAYSLMYPQDLESVTFVAAALFTRLPHNDHSVNLLLRLSPLRIIFGEFIQEWLINESLIERLLSSAYGRTPEPDQVRAYLEPLLLPGTMRAILSAPAYHRELKRLKAPDLELPSLAIWGEDDSWVPFSGRKPALESMKDTELVLIKGAGHNPMETHFREFMGVWLPFLENFK